MELARGHRRYPRRLLSSGDLVLDPITDVPSSHHIEHLREVLTDLVGQHDFAVSAILRKPPVGSISKKIRDWNEYERPKYRTVPRPQAAPAGLTTRLKDSGSATEKALEPLPVA